MAESDIRHVDPADLRLPSSMLAGGDAYKLQRQIAKYGSSITGMPLIQAYEGSDGFLEIYDGVTRATRIAKLSPGTLVQVEVIGKLRKPKRMSPSIGDRI
jgi:hypothetical protein